MRDTRERVVDAIKCKKQTEPFCIHYSKCLLGVRNTESCYLSNTTLTVIYRKVDSVSVEIYCFFKKL